MGGRGASAGLGGGSSRNAPPSAIGGGGGPVAVGGLSGLIDNLKNPHQNSADGINTDPVGDYDAGGNADLIRYQQQTDDDKLANYLAGTYKNTNLDDYDDGQYGFHDNSYQKLVLRMGLNNKPTELSDSDFNKYVQQTGEPVIYRGWSGQQSATRFTDPNSNYFHTGGGIYGDGIYFSTDKYTAARYGIGFGKKAITKMALSPQARVVDISDVRARMSSSSTKLQRALYKAGHAGENNGYGGNDGEAQMALKMGYNVIKVSSDYYVGLTGDAFVVSKTRL